MKKTLATLALTSVALLSTGAQADNSANRTYQVSVTNISKGLQFTPLLSASHKRNISFFEVGELASPELALLAEGGDVGPLNTLLEGLGTKVVTDTNSTEGLLNPGETVEFTLESGSFQRLSLAAMLLPTNDSFVALNSVRLPRYGAQTYYAKAYDAGSEPNDELCANIPGPVCGGGGPSAEEGGEGYVFPSQGIHGEGELSAATYDWRGPVAKVTVYRIK